MAESHASHAVAATAAEPHPVDDHAAHDVSKHVRGYWIVGGILVVFTFITVALAYVDFDKMLGGHGWNFIIAMLVATFKASLVAAIFMHLKGEKITIWRFLVFTMIFALGMFMLTWLHESDPITGTEFNKR